MKNRLLSYIYVLTLILYGIAGYHFLTGWHPIIMMFIGMAIGIAINAILYGIFNLIGKRFGKIPLRSITAVVSGIAVFIVLKLFGFGWPTLFYSIVVGLGILFFISLSWYLAKKSVVSGLFLGLTLIGVVYILFVLTDTGADPYDKELPLAFSQNDVFPPADPHLKNPASEGPFSIKTFTYGSGTDEKRDEFASGVTFKTTPVNGTWLIPDWKEEKKEWRESFWGFGVENFPLNGRVYMPEGKGPFPLTLIVHGNHSMIDYSDDGYGYLGNLLASRGIIAVSVDENFLNGHWSGDFMGKEMPARAWLLLKHLEQWRSWNSEIGHELSEKVDMDNIMLVGHSRGGEAVSIAAAFNTLPYFPDQSKEKFDFNFNIKGIVALAPTDYRYNRKIALENINFLSLQGSYDSDEVSFWGMRPYRRLQFTDSIPRFKAGVYIHHANHGQFNSTWGNSDFGAPSKWLLNLAPLLEEHQQQEAAKVFIGAFAEATLKNDPKYLSIFKNVALAKQWLPIEHYLTHLAPSNLHTIADFEEDLDITTAADSSSITAKNMALWKEQILTTRDEKSQENNAVFLGWDYEAAMQADSISKYSITLSEADRAQLTPNATLQLAIAAGDHEWLNPNPTEDEKEKNDEEEREVPQLDFRIQLTDGLGASTSLMVSEIKGIPKPLKTRFTKFEFLDKEMIGDDWEVQLQTYHFPMESFTVKNPDFNLEQLVHIEFIFDQTPYGVVVIDEIGFSSQ